MRKSNRCWLPPYGDPSAFLPKVQETRVLFGRRPYLFPDFVGRALGFLAGEQARGLGFEYEPDRMLPCKWKCSDESLFGVDLAIYAFTGSYPFDKGLIGAYFNEKSLPAAFHHGATNVDFGGSHVAYTAGPEGGTFGSIFRPAERAPSTDCGHLTSVVAPFKEVYEDACDNIMVYSPDRERVFASVPNEFLQPNWSSHRIKLLVDLETLAADEVRYEPGLTHTHTLIGRSLFELSPGFLAGLSEAEVQRLSSPSPEPIGRSLTHEYFNIFDSEAALARDGLPARRLLLYMKFVLAARHSPEPLKAAIINTALEHNRLTDAVRAPEYRDKGVASFSGVFIDLYDHDLARYVNLFVPMGLIVKPKGRAREVELTPEEIHDVLEAHAPATPRIPLEHVFGALETEAVLDSFAYRPGHFVRT